jgi:alcohol dehydrogenase (cytochrome c)
LEPSTPISFRSTPKTGAVLWDVAVADYKTGHSITVAPLIVKGMVVTGIAGGEYGIRGFLDAYDATTGQLRWRFWTVPGPGEKDNDSCSGSHSLVMGQSRGTGAGQW